MVPELFNAKKAEQKKITGHGWFHKSETGQQA